MIGIKIATGLLSAVFVGGGIIACAPQPVERDANHAAPVPARTVTLLTPAGIAATCAGFPLPVVASVNATFDSEGQIPVRVTGRYDMKWIAVKNGSGTCALVRPTESLPVGVTTIAHAVGVHDMDDLMGQALPVYVVAELDDVSPGCDCRVFAAIRLPVSAAPPRVQQRQYKGPPLRST